MSDAFKYVVRQEFDGHHVGKLLSRSDLAKESDADGEAGFDHRIGSHLIRVAVDPTIEPETANAEPRTDSETAS